MSGSPDPAQEVTLLREFRIFPQATATSTGKMRVNFRVENYNATNTPWFPRTGKDNVTAANFGSLNLSQTNTPKRFVLSARLLW